MSCNTCLGMCNDDRVWLPTKYRIRKSLLPFSEKIVCVIVQISIKKIRLKSSLHMYNFRRFFYMDAKNLYKRTSYTKRENISHLIKKIRRRRFDADLLKHKRSLLLSAIWLFSFHDVFY